MKGQAAASRASKIAVAGGGTVIAAPASKSLIRGYALDTGTFERPVPATVPASARKTTTLQCSRSSRPIIEMLAGLRDLKATLNIIKVAYASSMGDKKAAKTLGLIVADSNAASGAFAVPMPLDGGVTAAVRLCSAGNGFDAAPCVLFGDGLQQAVVMNFQSAAVSALVEMTRESFHKILDNPAQATGCLHALCANCPAYSPKAPNKRDWTIASLWPDWQARSLGFKARAIELAPLVGEAPPVLSTIKSASDRMRTCCSRVLHLALSDSSDLEAVTK